MPIFIGRKLGHREVYKQPTLTSPGWALPLMQASSDPTGLPLPLPASASLPCCPDPRPGEEQAAGSKTQPVAGQENDQEGHDSGHRRRVSLLGGRDGFSPWGRLLSRMV